MLGAEHVGPFGTRQRLKVLRRPGGTTGDAKFTRAAWAVAEFWIKVRACQGDDTMTVSRYRHIVTQPLCYIRKSRCSLDNFFIVSR
jgi:hypothetical protein